MLFKQHFFTSTIDHLLFPLVFEFFLSIHKLINGIIALAKQFCDMLASKITKKIELERSAGNQQPGFCYYQQIRKPNCSLRNYLTLLRAKWSFEFLLASFCNRVLLIEVLTRQKWLIV